MKPLIRCAAFLLLAVSATAGAQTAAGSLPDTGPVQVGWQDPNQFTEIQLAANKRRAMEGDWVRQLALYIQSRSARHLPAGQHLLVMIQDVKRAGDRRGLGEGVPVVRAVAAPSIRLRFVRTDTYGRVVSEGNPTLDDISVLGGPTRSRGDDPLVFEKRLVDGWLDKEFPPT
jgi:hypothetical protein